MVRSTDMTERPTDAMLRRMREDTPAREAARERAVIERLRAQLGIPAPCGVPIKRPHGKRAPRKRDPKRVARTLAELKAKNREARNDPRT